MSHSLLGRIDSKLAAFAGIARDNGTMAAARLTALKAARSKAPRKMRLAGEEFWVRPASPDIGVVRSCLGGEFDCLRHAYPADVTGLILDAGGYIGAAAVAFARMYPKATIVTVEPSAENFALLERNIAPYPNIRAIRAAIAPESGGQIELRDRGTGAWGFSVVRTDARDSRVLETVPTVGIEDLIDAHGAGRALIAKIDIEGAEADLFRTPAWLNRVGVMMIELHERIVPGCEGLFWHANAGRFAFKSGSEKYVSVGPALLTMGDVPSGAPAPQD
ncbi:FkbM family methyltransferase [Pararhodobacter sp. SW119]|uniref:FkbM family methyltransferase n=1 Tax=Pararhodobacter sp. SW119 TaxID=2780075 RepID=UPI001ADF5A4B|nr:FkbM family methyltransferase [Pararhodobacter sp. SW119]